MAQNVFVVTGIFQLGVQVAMIYAIRYTKSVWYHMVLACILFYAAALMPALNRLPQILHFEDSDAFTFAIMPLGILFVYFAIRSYAKQMYGNDNGNDNDESWHDECTKANPIGRQVGEYR